MAVTGWPTDAGAGQVATEDRWVQMARLWTPEGVVDGVTNELAPSFAAGQVTIQTGAAWINGHYAVNDAPVIVATAANGLVVLRYTVAGNVFAIAFNSGATVPTQTAAVWEIALAQVTGGVMTDRRDFTGGGRDWVTWTPTLSNVTLGSGTVIARYFQTGKLVSVFFSLLWAAGTAFTGSVTVTPPATPRAASYSASSPIIGATSMVDLSASAVFAGGTRLGTTLSPRAFATAAAYATTDPVNATVPFTWATGDTLIIEGTYEAD